MLSAENWPANAVPRTLRFHALWFPELITAGVDQRGYRPVLREFEECGASLVAPDFQDARDDYVIEMRSSKRTNQSNQWYG